MASVFDMKSFKHRPTRDAFDLSRKNLFSAKVGELLVASCDEIINGDKITKRPQNYTRTIAVNSAAYTTIREHFDYYFVPTRILWRGFPAWVTQQNTQTHFASSATSQIELANVQPYMTTQQIHNWLVSLMHSSAGENINAFGLGRAQNTVKLLQLLGYGDFSPSLQCESDVTYDTLYNENLTYSMFPLFAYQAVCDHYHRNVQWSDSHPWLFNLDYMVGSDPTDMQIKLPAIGNLNTFMDLQYALYKKDYFFGLYPDTQFGSVAVVDCSGPGNVVGNVHLQTSVSADDAGSVGYKRDYSWNDGNYYSLSLSNTSSPGADMPVSKIFISDADIASFNILQQRLAEAQQKWSEVTMSNYYDYVSQIDAHFGVKPDKLLSHSPQYVGGYTSTISISEVLNTNITDDNQAYIAGKGTGAANGTVTFDASKYGNEHGFLICLYYAEPILDYASSGVNRQNLRSLPTDYCIPEYENVGMQAVYLAELTTSKLTVSGIRGSDVLGYGPRYYDYKTRYDVVNGAFRSSLNYWAAPVTNKYIDEYLNAHAKYNPNAPADLLQSDWFKINPHLTDSIFGINAGDTVDTDCLLVNFFEDAKASRLISRYGLPY